MGQEVVKTNGSWDVPSVDESPSSSLEVSVGLMGGRSDGWNQEPEKEAEEIFTASSSSGRSSRGLAGLQNLGNTCFMNSALQCLAHTPELVEYFLQDYTKEINQENPLGMEGELALAFGELIRRVWAGNEAFVPRAFKAKLSRFAPQFSGYNQHDSQELLAFLLDGLHEDLNRVKCKPYIEVKDAEGRPDAEVAEEYWSNHKARNNSIIVDLFQGQYKSTLVCPVCRKVSVTFDPFMYLSLPLPETMNLTVTVFSGDGSSAPQHCTVQVPRPARCRDLCQALSDACTLRKGESLVVAKIDSNRIQDRIMEYSLLSPRDGDCLAAYRLRTFTDKTSALILYHGHAEESLYSFKKYFYGAPFVTCLPDEGLGTGAELYNLIKKILSPLRRGFESAEQGPEMETSDCPWPFQLQMTDEKTSNMGVKIDPDAPLPPTFNPSPGEHRYLVVNWTRKGLEQYEIKNLELPQVFHCGSRRPRQEPVSLYTCLEAFMKEEPLGPEDMWYCPKCKEHRQASKKLDLWRLPEVLVVHLKRFSYSRFLKNKLDTFVDFPVYDLDLSKYVTCKTDAYELFAVSNHYGGMGGGHYTAYAKLCSENKWYNFDDSHVSGMSSDDIKTTAAYVLFYRRKRRFSTSTPSETCVSNGVPPLDDWADFNSSVPPSN